MNVRVSGIGSRESEMGNDPDVVGSAPTPHSPLPTPQEPNWPLLYGIVLAELAILIVAFYAFTKAFA
jgi:hypothetical protein